MHRKKGEAHQGLTRVATPDMEKRSAEVSTGLKDEGGMKALGTQLPALR